VAFCPYWSCHSSQCGAEYPTFFANKAFGSSFAALAAGGSLPPATSFINTSGRTIACSPTKESTIMTRRAIIGIIFITAALIKLADMWGVIQLDWDHSWTEYFGPVLLFYVGAELVIYSFKHNPSQWLQRPVPLGEDGKRICCAVRFGADEYIYQGETFHGARLDAFFGGLRLDLRGAVVNEDEEIDIHTFLGGVEVIVPGNVNVLVKSHNFIGGVNNEVTTSEMHGAPCLHIVASNFMGGVTIKG